MYKENFIDLNRLGRETAERGLATVSHQTLQFSAVKPIRALNDRSTKLEPRGKRIKHMHACHTLRDFWSLLL